MNALHVRLVLFGLADGFRVALSILRDNRLRYSYVSKKKRSDNDLLHSQTTYQWPGIAGQYAELLC